jgi:hypothetical protein
MYTPITRLVVLSLLAVGSITAHAGKSNAAQMLEILQKGLAEARALPPGTRPVPPELNLAALRGISRADVKRALSTPSHCQPEDSADCVRSNTWSYEWGPANSEPATGDGYVTVTSGGPWLLVVEFLHDRVSGARWLGQR